jgi:phosphopantothenoylcysteine synthetase/decarboxylase
MDLTNSNVAKTVTKFSGSAPVMSSKTKNQQVAKTVVKIMGPIFVFCFARETIRWNREQRNVDKGIEIMEQQRREYLNMKKEEDDEDDDDDDDENDDDDDDDKDDDDDEE